MKWRGRVVLMSLSSSASGREQPGQKEGCIESALVFPSKCILDRLAAVGMVCRG